MDKQHKEKHAMTSLKTIMLDSVRKHAEAHIEKHRVNILVYLTNPAGIGEHSDIMDAIEKELTHMAEYEDHIEILDKYFKE
jgi:hypothetical protein